MAENVVEELLGLAVGAGVLERAHPLADDVAKSAIEIGRDEVVLAQVHSDDAAIVGCGVDEHHQVVVEVERLDGVRHAMNNRGHRSCSCSWASRPYFLAYLPA